MDDTKTLDREGIIEVLDLHRIKFTYARWIPLGLHGECACGWSGNQYDPPLTTSDYEPSRVEVRRECMEHIAEVLFSEAAAPATTRK